MRSCSKIFSIKFFDGSKYLYTQNSVWLSYFPYGFDSHVPIFIKADMEDFCGASTLPQKPQFKPIPSISGVISLYGSDQMSLITSLILQFTKPINYLNEVLLNVRLKGRSIGNWEHIQYVFSNNQSICIYPLYKPISIKNWQSCIMSLGAELDRIPYINKNWKALTQRYVLGSYPVRSVRGDRVTL
jgi:hypothetical protein